MLKALILVDIQNDFVPGGALAVPAGDQVVPFANKIIPGYELVIATQDWHPANHKSFASRHTGKNVGDMIQLDGIDQVLWPDHCVQGTAGAEFVPALDTDRINRIFQKGTDVNIDSYSGFFDNGQQRATGLAEYLRQKDVHEIDIIGLATDYCVKFTALDAVKLGFKTNVLIEGCRGVELNPGDCQKALEEMKNASVVIK